MPILTIKLFSNEYSEDVDAEPESMVAPQFVSQQQDQLHQLEQQKLAAEIEDIPLLMLMPAPTPSYQLQSLG